MGDPESTDRARHALDKAIAKVAEDEYGRLSAGLTPEECAQQVEDALQALSGLASGERPEYTEWEALMYLTWYQPRQVHLVYSVLPRPFPPDGQLRVVDLGCGAWAVQLAIAILAAEAPSVKEISVRGIDPSLAMRRLGWKLWAAFLDEAKESGLDRLVQVTTAMSRSSGSSDYQTWVASAERREDGSENGLSWLTAVHAVYQDNWSELKQVYRDVHRRVAPSVELVTTSRRTKKEDLVRVLVSQPCGGTLASVPAVACWKGSAVNTTNWRRALKVALGSSHPFLKNEVEWDRQSIEGDVVHLGRPMTLPQQRSLLTGASSPVDTVGPARFGAAQIDYRPARDILTRATGFMDAYDFTLNPYAGCAFGCSYCYAAFFSRSTSERDAWGEWVRVKKNAVELLARRRRGSLDDKRIYMSSVTDPYQPIERKLKLTRRLLHELAEKHRPKLVVQTRSPDVVGDADVLEEIVEKGGRVRVNMTVTTDDEEVRRAFEPACPSNARRLEAVAALAERQLETCVTMTPLLPVQDSERFAGDLRGTGVQHFIVQPFHFQRGKFVAGTRDVALGIVAAKLGCEANEVMDRYLEHYAKVRDVLDRRLPGLGEGKQGFEPPF